MSEDNFASSRNLHQVKEKKNFTTSFVKKKEIKEEISNTKKEKKNSGEKVCSLNEPALSQDTALVARI